MLSMDKRRAFGTWLLIAIFAYLALYVNDISYMIFDSQGDALMTFSMSGAMGMVTYMMPLFAALPFAAGFCSDWNSRFSGAAVIRCGKKKYLSSKIVACGLSGGTVAAGGTLLLILILVIKFPQSEDTMQNLLDSGEFCSVLSMGKTGLVLYYIGALIMQFLSGSFWALTGLAFSAFCPNYLLTLCVPLAAYRLCLELYYWELLPAWLCPPLLQDLMIGLNYWQTLLVGFGAFLLFDALMGFIFAIRAERRLRYAQ